MHYFIPFSMCVLIETLWNVKIVADVNLTCIVRCINRNIVECKVKSCACKFSMFSSINRNIVECKVRCNRCAYFPSSVLIETLWNVKLTRRIHQHLSYIVLIETLWNVKNKYDYVFVTGC